MAPSPPSTPPTHARAARLGFALSCLPAPALLAAALSDGGGAFWPFALGSALLAPLGAFVAARSLASAAGEAKARARNAEQNTLAAEKRANKLEQAGRDMREALDTLGRGLASVDVSGALIGEPSAALVGWFGPASAGTTIWDYLGENNTMVREWLRVTWAELANDSLPIELALDQLSPRLERKGRTIRLEYKASLEGGRLARVLVIASDATEEAERGRREAEQRDALHMCQWAAQDRDGFGEFLDEGGAIIARLAGRGAREKGEQMRLLHTLKGNCSLFGMAALASACHELEGRSSEELLPPAEMRSLALRWEATVAQANAMIGTRVRPALELDDEDYEGLRTTVARGATKAQILRLLDDLRREPVARRLDRIAEQTRAFARRVGKGDIVVRTESNRLRLPSEAWAGVWSALAHALRNALDHGIEAPDARGATGKVGPGKVILRARPSDEPDFIELEVEDDGRGVDWARVRQKAAEQGLPCESPEDLHEALFHTGLSTKDSVDEQSGRGAGLSALRVACEQLGGSVRLWSEPGQGTRVCARLPLHGEASQVSSRRAPALSTLPSWAQEAGPLSRFATIDGSAFRR